MSDRSLEFLRPTETVELESGLSLVPRVKLLLTVSRADKSVSPVDEWKLKRSLIDYLKNTQSVTVQEEDLEVRRFKDLNKRKRDDPVARGTLCIRDLGFLAKLLASKSQYDDEKDEVKAAEKNFLEWRRGIVERMDGMEVNIEGTKFKLSAVLPASDDFEGMKKEWEEIAAFGGRGYQRGSSMQPDTLVLRGLPSRWFAETRVSSKPSMLVSHTIFSTFGNIRNIDVAEDNYVGKDVEEDGLDIISGLQCKIVVRFKKHKDFCNALKALCGRSLQKQGSRLRADYDVTWDKDGYFRNDENQTGERNRWVPAREALNERDEAPRSRSRNFSYEDGRRKRFKVGW
nr:A-kinase anchor protein 17A [Ipomoea batatas]